MSVQKSVWRPEVIEFLEAKNEFLNHAVNADEYVVDGKIIYIPQAGAPSNIEIDRSQLPAPIVKRTDTTVLYELNEFTSDPILLTESDSRWLSYDKRQSIIRDKFKNMRSLVAKMMLYNWAVNIPASGKLKTTGTSTHTATAPGATGTRKNMLVKDIQTMQAFFDAQDIDEDGRYALLESNMYGQLMENMTQAQQYAFKDATDVKKGVVGELYGFKIMKRSSVLVFNDSDVVKHPKAATATSDNVASLFWAADAVERAYGDIKLFEKNDQPEYFGDIMSCLAYAGGRARRADGKGVAVLIADA